MKPNAKIIPMTHAQIRAEFKKLDNTYHMLTPCGLSFNQLMSKLKGNNND